MLPPWHLWGTENQFSVSNTTGTQQTLQLARVKYKRPETWSFLCWAKIDAIEGADATDTKISVVFDFFVGLGRTTLNFKGAPTGVPGPFNVQPGLVNFQFPIGAIQGSNCWTTSSQAQGQIATDFATALTPLIDHFPADEIQVSATVAAVIVSAYTVKLSAGCMLAPRTHVRPDWFAHKFPDELGGS